MGSRGWIGTSGRLELTRFTKDWREGDLFRFRRRVAVVRCSCRSHGRGSERRLFGCSCGSTGGVCVGFGRRGGVVLVRVVVAPRVSSDSVAPTRQGIARFSISIHSRRTRTRSRILSPGLGRGLFLGGRRPVVAVEKVLLLILVPPIPLWLRGERSRFGGHVLGIDEERIRSRCHLEISKGGCC